MIRPGKSYRLLESFAASSAIAPDIPFLSLRAGERIDDREDLDLQVRRGRAYRDWETTSSSRRGQRPSAAARDYQLSENGGHHSRNINTARSILEEIPEGALIFVPGPSLADKALLGEMGPPHEPRVEVVREVGRNSIRFLGRPILNPVRLPMRNLPRLITDIPKNRGLVAGDIEEEARLRLYLEYYGSFQLGDDLTSFQFRAGERDFTVQDATALTTIALAIDDVAAGRNVRFASMLGLLSQERENSPIVHANINSPNGRITAQALQRGVIVVAALLALSMIDDDSGVLSALEQGTVSAVHECNGQPEEDAQMETELLYNFYHAMGADNCREVLEIARHVVEKTDGNFDAEAQ